jgi:hypothetical protein
MTSLEEKANDGGISPFLARNLATVDSAGAVVAHQSVADVADMENLSGGVAPARLHHDGGSFGHHHPLQQFGDFSQHVVDATDSTAIDPSLSDQLALTHSPLAFPEDVLGFTVAGAGPLLPPEPGHSRAETSPETHAWIADTIYRSGTWPQQ